MFLLMFGHHEEEQVRSAPGRCLSPQHRWRASMRLRRAAQQTVHVCRSMASWRASR